VLGRNNAVKMAQVQNKLVCSLAQVQNKLVCSLAQVQNKLACSLAQVYKMAWGLTLVQ